MHLLKNAFAELRSLANKHSWNTSDKRKILNLTKQAHQHSPIRYIEQWQPYLQQFTRHWQQTFLTTKNLQEAEEINILFPFAKLEIILTAKDLQKLTQTPENLKPQIVEINLSGQHLSNEQISLITSKLAPINVMRVNLQSSNLQANQLEQLINWLDTKNLQQLELSQNIHIKHEAINLISNTPAPSHLTYLGLARNELNNQDCEKLAELEWQNLEELDISKNAFSDRGAFALAESKGFPALKTLKCTARYNWRGTKALAHSTSFPKLKAISLNTGTLTNNELTTIKNLLSTKNITII